MTGTDVVLACCQSTRTHANSEYSPSYANRIPLIRSSSALATVVRRAGGHQKPDSGPTAGKVGQSATWPTAEDVSFFVARNTGVVVSHAAILVSSRADFDGVSIAGAAFAAGVQFALVLGRDLSASAAGDIDFDSVLEKAAELLETDHFKNADAALSEAFGEFVARQTNVCQIQSGRTAAGRKRACLPNHPQLWSKAFSQSEGSDAQKRNAHFVKRFYVRGHDESLLSERARFPLPSGPFNDTGSACCWLLLPPASPASCPLSRLLLLLLLARRWPAVARGQRSTEGAATLWTTPTCPSLTRRHPKTSANSTLGKSTVPTDYSSPSPSVPTATSARSSATSFLAKGPASPCPRSKTDRKPTSPTCAPPRTPPPLMSSPQHAPTGSATSPDISLAILTRHQPHANISSRSLGSTPQKPSPSCSTTHSSTSSAPRPAARPPIGPRPGPTTAPHTFSQILP
ncbi:hypothetical protein THAOC_03060 [Thalassiosira oceanica]|uniref:Uncharacterized protein n=1 Tax=Thalassiosira oceanica TaxID=159749 RepID=K0TDQ0_THAOC|nr:hypothetical protein THAOC_03060 [Thalassiosira oceanica]|eukprot:EJK75224.1 hypothetical protein THAOC_03060 [Thalassiosira oceanica]